MKRDSEIRVSETSAPPFRESSIGDSIALKARLRKAALKEAQIRNARIKAWLKRGTILLTLISLAIYSYLQMPYNAYCVGLSDGDTLQVMRGEHHETIRLYGIDCPEGAQRWSRQATYFTAALVLNQTISIHPVEKDRYGRTVARVYRESRCVNEELVAAGLAWWYSRLAPNDTIFTQLEEQARAAKKGLWSEKTPVPPWNWRFNAMLRYRFGSPAGNQSLISAKEQSQIPPENRIIYTKWSDHHYHQKGCTYLDGTELAVALRHAVSKGYSACEICNANGL